ncbi:MAG: tol-pal system protein YbgF [Deltaproteobacteria bacterium]|jgi:tol-pal system protein YbgF|nr:tol-pal system protein YbgF [Deltaproteobacteria bacterium]
MKIRNFVLSGCLLLFLGACAYASRADLQTVNARLENNEKQVEHLNSQIGLASGGMVPGQAEIWAQFQALSQEFNQLRGQVEDLSSRGADNAELKQLREQTGRLEASVRHLSSVLAVELPMLEAPPETAAPAEAAAAADQAPADTAGPADPAAAAVAAARAAGTAGGGAAPPAGIAAVARPQAGNTNLAKTLYDSGTKAFSDRRYDDAVRIFTDFINTYPRHSLISNAHFWQGESYYQLKNYSNAILAYQQVIEKYPGSNKLQSCMFKQGVAMYRRGQKDAAQVRLNELIRKYPKSTEATRAKQFLENMK